MAKTIPDYIKSRYAIEDLTSSLGLLRIIDERGQITQAQGAEAMGLSIGTCNLHFQKLEHVGLIRRVETVTKGRGRSTIIWELDRGRNFCLLLLFDVPNLRASLVDFDGKVVLERQEDLDSITDSGLIERMVEDFMETALGHVQEADGHVRQVFVGMPGILDPYSGIVLNSATFPVLKGMDFKMMMQQQYGLSCHLLGLGFYHGEVRHLPAETRAFVLEWNIGIRAVAGVGERVISHANKESLLSEVGHVVIERNGKPCHCGRKGCLEAYTGGWEMIEALADEHVQSLEEFCDVVLGGNTKALEIAGAAAYTLGKSLTWTLQVMQSKRLIVSGPLSRIFPMVRDRFVEGLSTIFTDAEIAQLNPVSSNDPLAAMQYGAYRCARRKFFYPEE
jgi:predicted NBD/HSP70 family sugar kinase